jgi:flagellar motor component MotA
MNRADFVAMYETIMQRALHFSEKARREGLLALDEEIVAEKVAERDILEYGLRFVIDGTDRDMIEKILSNIVNQEQDERLKILKTMQKEAVLMIQEGINRNMLYALLNSYTDIAIKDDAAGKLFE